MESELHMFNISPDRNPAVSVCMATFNGSKYLFVQLSSILDQLDPQDELVIVDDASTDETVLLIRGLNDPRIKLHLNDSNLGVVRTFEKALLLARGELVFLSDQDDRWESNKVEVVRNFFAKENVDLLLHDARIEGEMVSESLFQVCNTSKGVLKNIVSNTYTGCCMAFKRQILEDILPIPVRRGIFHDAWIGIMTGCMGFNVSLLPLPLMIYRRHAQNVSTMKTRSYLEIIPDRIALLYEVLRKAPHCLSRRLSR